MFSGQFESTAGFLTVFCGSSNMQFAVNPFAKGLIFSKHFLKSWREKGRSSHAS
jgi:hypothetical protein